MLRSEWNWTKDNMFFLTRDGDIEISHSDDDWEHCLFHYANQVSLPGCHLVEGVDEFGRNRIDRLFIRLCVLIHVYVICNTEIMFKSLSCKKDGSEYRVHLELNNETLEQSLAEMVSVFERRS